MNDDDTNSNNVDDQNREGHAHAVEPDSSVSSDSNQNTNLESTTSSAPRETVGSSKVVPSSLAVSKSKKRRNRQKKSVSFKEEIKSRENGENYLDQLSFLSGTKTKGSSRNLTPIASKNIEMTKAKKISQPAWRKFLVFVLCVLVSVVMTFGYLRIALNIFCKYDPDRDSYIVVDKVDQCPVQVEIENNEKGKKNLFHLFGKKDRGGAKKSVIYAYEPAPISGIQDKLCRGTFNLLHATALALHPRVHYKTTVPTVHFLSPCPTIENGDSVQTSEKKTRNVFILLKNGIIHFGKKILQLIQRKHRKQVIDSKTKESTVIKSDANDWTALVSAPLSLSLTANQQLMVQKVITMLKDRIMKEDNFAGNTKDWFETRMKRVKYSSGALWWLPEQSNWGDDKEYHGTRLITSFLNIMKWPDDLVTNYPYSGICADGCPADFAVYNSLRYREEYQPQKMTVSALKENKNGWVYVRGYSPSRYHPDSSIGGASILWMTPGLQKMEDPEPYTRVLMNAIDRCIGDALVRSGGTNAKCNIVVDCAGFGLSKIPPLVPTKRALKMLQDHNPDRLGVLVMLNASSAAQMFLKVLMPFLPDIVRKKIHLVPNDPSERMEMMKELVEEKFIPVRLGGADNYKFNADHYYNSEVKTEVMSDEEGIKYYETIPYYAP